MNIFMLTQSQRAAIEITQDPLIVIAGPGTGKTTLITNKILNLLDIYKKEEILALTFTQKAAEEMSNRVEFELNKISSKNLDKNSFVAKTFHSFALEILEEFQTEISSLNENFKCIGKSKDNSIEIAILKQKKVLCLMFHPERKNKSQKSINKLITNFLSIN